jgi:hypothetical protein
VLTLTKEDVNDANATDFNHLLKLKSSIAALSTVNTDWPYKKQRQNKLSLAQLNM